MADIRINALATTAASTASDDFVAVDGSANGTRKLNAYSPTFGGNLTVNGTDVKINNSTGYVYVDGGSSLTGFELLRSSNAVVLYTANVERLRVNSAGLTTLAGNLTVSGTGTSSFAGTVNSNVGLRCTATNSNLSLYKDGTPSKAARVILNGSVADGLSLGLYNGTSWTDTLHISTNNNVLIGTTTDGSNGKIQLADHTTSAGGIGFGTETQIYRRAAGNVAIDSNQGSTILTLSYLGNVEGSLSGSSSGGLTLAANGATSLLLTTNGTTALTLDSSQRCILAGALRLNNAYVSGAPTATGYVTLQDSAGNTYKVLVGT